MKEKLTPRNVIAGVTILALGTFGLGEAVDYYAERAGRTAGNELIQTVEESEVGEQKVEELQELMANEFTAQWLADRLSELREEGVDAQWVMEHLVEENNG